MNVMGYNVSAKKNTPDDSGDVQSAAPKVSGTPKERIKRYQNDLKVSAKYFDKNWYKRAKRHIELYELNHYYNPQTGETETADYDRIKVPYIYSNTRQLLAEIYTKTPEPIVKPTKIDSGNSQPQPGAMPPGGPMPADPSSPALPPFQPKLTVPTPADQQLPGMPNEIQVDVIKGAEKLKASIEYCARKSRMKHQAKMVVLDGLVTGLGALMFSAQKGSKIPKYTRIVYRDILFWHGADNPYDSPWVTRRVVRPIDDAKSDPNYNKAVAEGLKANSTLDKELLGDMTDTLGQFQFVVIWDRWDKKNDTHCVWADNGEDFLIEETMSEKYKFEIDDEEFVSDYPFIFFVDEEMISKPFGMGDVWPIESQNKELDKIRTIQLNHMKRFNRKYMSKKGFMDEQGIAQFKHNEDGTMVEVKEDITPNNFQVIQDAPLSGDIYRGDEIIQRDIQIISPIGPNSLVRGVGKAPDTLGQAQLIEENANTRLDEKRDNVAEMFKRIFRLTAQYIQQYWVEEDVLLVTGDGTKPTDWLSFSPQEIMGEYDYDVDPETLRDNTSVYRQQAQSAIQTVAPILTGMGAVEGVQIMVKQYLSTFPAFERLVDKIVPDQPPPPPPGPPPKPLVAISAHLNDLALTERAQALKQDGIIADPQGPPMPPSTTESPQASGSQNDGASQDGQVTPDRAQLIQLIQTQGPKAVLDKIKTLPDNKRQVITQEVASIYKEMGMSGT